MYFLAVDTATNSGGVALSRNSEVMGVIMMKTPMKYSDRIISNIDFLLEQLGVAISQVDCFVTAHGPGSFTGLRIGLATIKGLAQSLDKPVIGLSTLECLAKSPRLLVEEITKFVETGSSRFILNPEVLEKHPADRFRGIFG